MAENIEHRTLLSCLSSLTNTLQHNLSLSVNLLEKGLVTEEVHGWQLTATAVSNHEKASRLLACVTDSVKGSSQLYYVFLDILKEEQYFKEVVEKICAENKALQESCLREEQKTKDGCSIVAAGDQTNDDGIAKEVADSLEERFEDIREKLLTELIEECSLSPEDLIDSLTRLPIALRAEYQKFISEKVDRLQKADSIKKVFHHINPLLTFMDYNLLEHLIKKHGSKQLKEEMAAYVVSVKVFLGQTTIGQLADYWPGLPDIPPHFERLKVTIKGDPKAITLQELNNLRKKICCEISLADSVLVLIGVALHNSYSATWIVPAMYVPQLKSILGSLRSLKEFYNREDIVSVTLGKRRLFPVAVAAEHDFIELCLKGTGDISEFQYLLSQPGVEPNLCDKDGRTLLSRASSRGRTDLVQLLLDHGADVDLPDDGKGDDTALMVACRNGHVATADLLINKGASVNYLNKKGEHALGEASYFRRLDCVKLLLHHKAQIDLPEDNDLGFTALMLACQSGHTEVADLLIEKGAMVEYHNKVGATPLTAASRDGHNDVVQLLLDRGAHVDHMWKDDVTPLITASQFGHSKVVLTLVERGAKINHQTTTGWTPLHCACVEGHKAVVEILIKHGAQLDIKTKNGDTPLMMAIEHGHNDIVKILKDAETKAIEDRGLEEALLTSAIDASLKEGDKPSSEVLSQKIKKIVLSVEASPHPPKVVDPPGPVLTQSPKESRTHGEEASPHSPQETTTTAATEMEYDFVEQPPKEFFCPVTFELLLSPHLTFCCGNHISEKAVKRLKRENMPCPICKEPELATVLDKFHRRRIREVQVRCPHKASGCSWVGEVGQLQSHMDLCLNRHDSSSSDTASLPVESH